MNKFIYNQVKEMVNMEQQTDPHEKIFSIIFSKTDEITWQSILFDLVKTEQMDPWNIDVSILSQKYIGMLRSFKEHDFRISGKVLLAAAILLKIKSNRLVGDDLSELDRLLMGVKEEMEDLGFEEPNGTQKLGEIPALMPRTPQPRKRKVSIFDLVDALERALEVKKRRLLYSIPPLNLEAPKKKKDITEVIREVYGKIKAFFIGALQGSLTFTKLLPSDAKDDKVHTFIPLLYLAQQNKIELVQNAPFGEIEIMLKKKSEPVQDGQEQKAQV